MILQQALGLGLIEFAVGIRMEGLSRRYGDGETAVDALKEVTMSVAPGEVVGLIGPSGCGKALQLRCLGAVIEPTRGRMTLGGDVIYDNAWKISDLRVLRRDGIVFIFQAPYLIPFLDVTDNVALLPMLAGRPNGEARARALAGMRILNQMASEYQTAIIVVTHDEKTIATFRRIYNVRDGRTFGKWGKGGRWSNRAKVIAGRHSRRRPLR